MNKAKLSKIIFDALTYDFDLDEDDVYDLMSAVKPLLNNIDVVQEPTGPNTKAVLTLALCFGQSSIGGSRVDYAVSDILNAFNGHLNITKISHDYLQSLANNIQQYALNPQREFKQIQQLTQTMPDI